MKQQLEKQKKKQELQMLAFLDNFEEWIKYDFQYQGELVHKKVVFFLAETKTKEC